MSFPELHYRHDFAGTTGLIYFGAKTVLSYVRDGNTPSYPYHVDLIGGGRELNASGVGETPFETWRRECQEEIGLDTDPTQIIYAKQWESLIDPARIGYFVVVQFQPEAVRDIRFGSEGLHHQLTSERNLLADPRLIRRRKEQIKTYLSEAATKPTLIASA